FLDRLPLLPIFAALALYQGYSYYEFSHDPSGALVQEQSQLSSVKDQNADLQRKIAAAKSFFQTLSQKRDELRAMATQLDQMKTVLTEDLDIPGFIKIVVTEARKVGLRVLSIKPSPPNEQPYYTEQPFI